MVVWVRNVHHMVEKPLEGGTLTEAKGNGRTERCVCRWVSRIVPRDATAVV
jgi:hypothetical protein